MSNFVSLRLFLKEKALKELKLECKDDFYLRRIYMYVYTHTNIYFIYKYLVKNYTYYFF